GGGGGKGRRPGPQTRRGGPGPGGAGRASPATRGRASALGGFWSLRGHYGEGRDWLDWALASPAGAPAEVRAKALQCSGMLAHLQCEDPAAVRRLEAALTLYRELGDRRGPTPVLPAP